MDFDDWMLTKDPKYHPTDDTVALRRLRECWNDAQKYGGQKVGAGKTAVCPNCGRTRLVGGTHKGNSSAPCHGLKTHNAEVTGA